MTSETRLDPTSEATEDAFGDDSRRERIIAAASSLLRERGYASTSTLDIATRARLSKRELYRLFDNKQAILEACIERRAAQIRIPLAQAQPAERRTLAAGLVSFGSAVLRELSDPMVVALYRLAASETKGTPEIGTTLDNAGREVIRNALIGLLAEAQALGAIGAGDPATMAAEFFGLLWGDLHLRLILGVAAQPTARERDWRARHAADALLRIHPTV